VSAKSFCLAGYNTAKNKLIELSAYLANKFLLFFMKPKFFIATAGEDVLSNGINA